MGQSWVDAQVIELPSEFCPKEYWNLRIYPCPQIALSFFIQKYITFLRENNFFVEIPFDHMRTIQASYILLPEFLPF